MSKPSGKVAVATGRPASSATSAAVAGPAADLPPPRQRILAAACDLFYRHGIHPVGVEAIAEAAATNKMTLYRHFGSKDDLVAAYVAALADEGDAIWRRIAAAHPDDPAQRLEMWMAYVQDVLENRFERGCALANAAIELGADHPARVAIESYKQRKRDRLVGLFRELRYKDPALLADEVFLLFEGARVSKQCGAPVPPARILDMLRDLLKRTPRKPGRAHPTGR